MNRIRALPYWISGASRLASVVSIFVFVACRDHPVEVEPVSSPVTQAETEALEQPEAVAPELASLPPEKRPALPAAAKLHKVVEADGALTLPAPGVEPVGETHMRHSWALPEGAEGVLSIARWEDTSFGEVEFAVGTGNCPHRGKKLAAVNAADGLAVVHYQLDPLNPAQGDKWFLHVNADTVLETKAGNTLDYHFTIYTY